MSYADTLAMDIHGVLDRLAEKGAPWNAAPIAREVIGKHEAGLSDHPDRDFWLHVGYAHVRAEVTRCINRRAGA